MRTVNANRIRITMRRLRPVPTWGETVIAEAAWRFGSVVADAAPYWEASNPYVPYVEAPYALVPRPSW